jgi:hypothetical protein
MPVTFPWDEALYGDAQTAAGVEWLVDLAQFQADNDGKPWTGETKTVGGKTYARVLVYGDEPTHAARYALYALATRPENKGRWSVDLAGSPIDAQLVAQAVLWFVANCTGEQFSHPYVQATGCSDRAFARGFATLAAAAKIGILDGKSEAAGLSFLKGAARVQYGYTPGANVNLGKGNPTMVPPFGDDTPVWQFFGMCLVPATLYDLAWLVGKSDPVLAADLRMACVRLARWTVELQGDPAADAPGYVTVPPALRTPGNPVPDSLAPYIADGSAVRHYGDGTGVGKYWAIRSLRCAGALGYKPARDMADALVAQIVAFGKPSGLVGWAADENGNALVDP